MWRIPVINEENAEGSMEFSCAASDADDFFPVDVSFHSSKTYAGIQVSAVSAVGDGAPVPFSTQVQFGVDKYLYV